MNEIEKIRNLAFWLSEPGQDPKVQTLASWLGEYVQESMTFRANLAEAMKQLEKIVGISDEWRTAYLADKEKRIKAERAERALRRRSGHPPLDGDAILVRDFISDKDLPVRVANILHDMDIGVWREEWADLTLGMLRDMIRDCSFIGKVHGVGKRTFTQVAELVGLNGKQILHDRR